MKIQLTKDHWKALGYILVLLAVSPFALEFLLMAEFVGAEFAVTFMLVYFKSLWANLVQKWWRFKHRLAYGFDEVIKLVMFQPKPYGISATASCVVIVMTGSTFVACAIWLR